MKDKITKEKIFNFGMKKRKNIFSPIFGLQLYLKVLV
jgi:hypothetical protein